LVGSAILRVDGSIYTQGGVLLIELFDKEYLSDEWIIGPEPKNRDDRYWSLTKNPGFLTITTEHSDIHSTGDNPSNYFLRPVDYENYQITTYVEFFPEHDFEQAGLLVYSGPDDYVRLGYVHAWGYKLEAAVEVNQLYNNQMLPIEPLSSVYLRIRKLGRQYSFHYSHDGKLWEQIGTPIYVTLREPLVGLYAISPASGRHIDAKFSMFAMEELDPAEYQVHAKFPPNSFAVQPKPGQVQLTYINPVFNNDAPDPAILRWGNFFYSCVTNNRYQGKDYRLMILRSPNLVDWTVCGEVFPKQLPAWIDPEEPHLWAPELVEHQGRIFLYFAALGKGGQIIQGPHGIGVAWANHPEGPYEFAQEPLLIGSGFHYIDPMVFTDDDGSRYLYWGSNHQPIYGQQLADDGLTLIGDPIPVILPQIGPMLIDADLPPRPAHESLVEAPWMIKRGDYYYLFYSGDDIVIDRYAVSVARSLSPLGSFEKNVSNPILLHNLRFTAPGHNAVIQDDAGQDWLIYHARDRTNQRLGRVLLIDRIDWQDGWPVINNHQGPTYHWQEQGPIIKEEVK